MISTHAPHAECDAASSLGNAFNGTFQLTHPTRSATKSSLYFCNAASTFQLTHPTRSATIIPVTLYTSVFISTHAPHAECDWRAYFMDCWFFRFQLTHPTRSATSANSAYSINVWISTHAPHAECDFTSKYCKFKGFKFQLTHPTRSAT